MTDPPTRAELEAAWSAEADDVIAGRPEMTAFRQTERLRQARWREAHGHPVGSQPMVPRPGRPVRPVGSRIPIDYGRETGANLLTPAALAAARERTSRVERHQSFDQQRLWADLLSSEALAFNLFGDLAADHDRAERAIRRWWPDTPGRVVDLRFAWSPGRLDPAWLNSLRAFDAAVVLDRGDDRRAIVAIDVKLHERAKAETPKPENRRRYVEVAERSGAFRPGVIPRLMERTDLAVMWLEHLLLFSMLQHGSGAWSWGRYVVVRPAANPDVAGMVERYRELLADPSTFTSITLEEIVASRALPRATAAAIRERYLSG